MLWYFSIGIVLSYLVFWRVYKKFYDMSADYRQLVDTHYGDPQFKLLATLVFTVFWIPLTIWAALTVCLEQSKKD